MSKEGIENLPDVTGLETFVSAGDLNQDTGSSAPDTTQSTSQNSTQQNVNADTGNQQQIPDIEKSYKEIQGFATRVSQENSELKKALAQLKEQVELVQLQQQPVQRSQPQNAGKDFDSLFIENPQQAITAVASQAMQQQLEVSRKADVLQEEYAKNSEEYQERYAYASRLLPQYPQLGSSPAGLRKLFELGDKIRLSEYQRKGMALVKAALGDDVDIEKFKQLVKSDQAGTTNQTQTNNAYMPDTTMSSRTGTDSGKNVTIDQEIQAGVKSGDMDAVLNVLFKEKGLRK
jgi:vacuolar-type H+-ATPase subunit I/STV1